MPEPQNELDTQSAPLAQPYRLTRSRLGITSKVFSENFICNLRRLHTLNDTLTEKLSSIRADAVGFRYLVSFEDRTHVDHDNLGALETLLESTDKPTERLVLKWTVLHNLDGDENEVTVTVRISNPVNPLIMLQAALSKSPEDIDNFEFENGSVAVSVDGTSLIFAQEIFEAVSRWISSCPKPVSMTKTNELLTNNRKIIQFSNYSLVPALAAVGFFAFLIQQSSLDLIASFVFIGVVGHTYLRSLASALNKKIDRWVEKSHRLSLFQLTGGDSNKQNALAVRAQRSTGKLLRTAIGTLIINVIAAVAASYIVLGMQ